MKPLRPMLFFVSLLLIVGLACSGGATPPTQAPPTEAVQDLPTQAPPQPSYSHRRAGNCSRKKLAPDDHARIDGLRRQDLGLEPALQQFVVGSSLRRSRLKYRLPRPLRPPRQPLTRLPRSHRKRRHFSQRNSITRLRLTGIS